MAGIPSVVECIKLAGMAWTIGRAFTSGRAGAPSEFQEVESELIGLTTALNLLAETLDDDDGILSRADEKTRTGVQNILECCGHTLQDLESFVASYSEIKKVDNGNSQTVERKWKRFFIKHWKTVVWTTEGGNIQSLRNMLHIHIESITMTMHALQSKSLTRLEATIEPMAAKINDIHFLVMSVVEQQRRADSLVDFGIGESQSTLPARSPMAIEDGGEVQRSYDNIFGNSSALDGTEQSTSRTPTSLRPPANTTYRSGVALPEPSCLEVASVQRGSRPLPLSLYPESLPRPEYVARPQSGSESHGSSRLESRLDIMDDGKDEKMLSPRNREYPGNHYPSPRSSYGNSTPIDQTAPRRTSSISLPPTPASPASPASPGVFVPPTIRRITEANMEDTSPDDSTDLESVPKAISTEAEHEAFRKELFRETITLCDLKVKKIKFAQWDEENGENRMVEAASNSSVYLIRKKDTTSNRVGRFTSSIWALSDSHRTRMQQKVTDDDIVIPYTLWGAPENVVIRLESLLRFHDTSFGSKPLSTAKTSWVTYYFEDERASTLFQSALMNQTLILSVKTNKTIRLHRGLPGLLTLQEQMCALENLHLWQDPTTGGVFAMIHYSASFRKGYMAFYINSHKDPIRAQDDGERFVKIKGLVLPCSASPTSSSTTSSTSSSQHHQHQHLQQNQQKEQQQKRRKPSLPDPTKSEKQKVITGARIEFTTDLDKRLFLETVREVQGNFFAGSDAVLPGVY